jgi:hypothetical protein
MSDMEPDYAAHQAVSRSLRDLHSSVPGPLAIVSCISLSQRRHCYIRSTCLHLCLKRSVLLPKIVHLNGVRGLLASQFLPFTSEIVQLEGCYSNCQGILDKSIRLICSSRLGISMHFLVPEFRCWRHLVLNVLE